MPWRESLADTAGTQVGREMEVHCRSAELAVPRPLVPRIGSPLL